MKGFIAALTIVLLIGLVIIRVSLMNKKGIRAMLFGRIDKKDFLIPPFVFFYFYLIFAAAFDLPTISHHKFFEFEIAGWIGICFCLAGLVLFTLSLISFGSSFRVGIDIDQPDKLVTSGIFAYTRNPIYVAFWIILLGQFLVFPNWILLIFLAGATIMFHRQVILEEAFLEEHHGQDFLDYCDQVKRYI